MSTPPDRAPAPARILALDVGARRIGCAISDPLAITAQGLATLERSNQRADLQALHELALHHGARLWLLGLPLHLSGDEGRQAQHVRAWGERLERHTRLPVRYWDERLTTVEAHRVLRSAGSSLAQTRRAIDRLAAVVLLQSYLDFQALARARASELDRARAAEPDADPL